MITIAAFFVFLCFELSFTDLKMEVVIIEINAPTVIST